MSKPSRLGFINLSPLFRSRALKSPEKYQTSADLFDQYGFMDENTERAYRAQASVMGRPLTRAEQRSLTPGLGEMKMGSKLVMYGVVALLLYSMYVAYNVDTKKKVYVF